MQFRFLIIILLIGLVGCRHSHREDEQRNELTEQVTLNDGKRWLANAETTAGIKAMISAIDTTDPLTTESVATLKDVLQENFASILKQCTMKGEAHNQLHHYLVPLKKEIDQLSIENIPVVRAHLLKYDVYFN
ncbi:MAG: hypothetical protein MUE95_02040 [Cyclobacteriaceae bacterium]|jgi:hypothetical protein|nr:hypothetical protein [Cyclobacteriaceae bacterium]